MCSSGPHLTILDDPQGWISVENILPWLITLFFNLIAHSNTIFFVVLYPWEFKTVFNNQLHILINLGKYIIARPKRVQNLWFWSRASNGSRLSAFVQISALFQIYITDMSRHLHHLTKCPFEVKKGLKGLFLHWEVIANKQTLPYFVLPSGLRLLCRHWGFCADIVQISAQKNARWKLCSEVLVRKLKHLLVAVLREPQPR